MVLKMRMPAFINWLESTDQNYIYNIVSHSMKAVGLPSQKKSSSIAIDNSSVKGSQFYTKPQEFQIKINGSRKGSYHLKNSNFADHSTLSKVSRKRFKTEEKINLEGSSKRLTTDITNEHSAEPQRFLDDHHNTQSIAELLQYSNYHPSKTNRIDAQKKQSEQSQQQKLKQEESDEVDEEYEPSNFNSKASRGKRGSEATEKNKKSDSDVYSSYTLGAVVENNQENNIKLAKDYKPQLRSYSHFDKMKIIGDSKYVPQSEQQLRMQQRYLKGQLATVNNLRQLEEMDKIILSYKKSKKQLLQQSARKHETSRLISMLKAPKPAANQQPISKVMSLPKLAICIELPIEEATSSNPEVDSELKKIEANCKNLEGSLSIQKFEYGQKRNKALRKCCALDSQEEQFRDIEHIENVLKRKGISFNKNTIRKGLLSVNRESEVNFGERIELPKSLISNPKYKKYPL